MSNILGCAHSETVVFLRGSDVGNFNVFIIRAVFGAVFAVILSRFFHPELNLIYVAGLGILLVALAYFFDYLRNRKSNS